MATAAPVGYCWFRGAFDNNRGKYRHIVSTRTGGHTLLQFHDWDEASAFLDRHGDSGAHRVGGPAFHLPPYCASWRCNGKWHRVDGPALDDEWYMHGKKHRIDGGPARAGLWMVSGVQIGRRGWQRRGRRLRWLLHKPLR